MAEQLWSDERIEQEMRRIGGGSRLYIDDACTVAEQVRDDLQAALDAANQRVEELEASFDLRWDSDMRAIKQWQAATGEELKWPNHADLCVWLMQRIAELEAQAAREPIPQSLEYDLITYAIKHGELPQGYSLFRRKEAGE